MEQIDEVYNKLSQVFDPELDQTLTELHFIDHVNVSCETVHVIFRLPTYWCSPNFAFMMATDIRDRVSELEWVKQVHVQLIDHQAATEINAGVAKCMSFSETFPELANEDLETLRLLFRQKAFISRQEKLYRWLLKNHMIPETAAEITFSSLHLMTKNSEEGTILLHRYLQVMREMHLPSMASDHVFVELNGTSIGPVNIESYMSKARRTRVSQEFNAVYCRGLLNTRYNEKPIEIMGAN